jgi:hypothetical protein
MNQGVAGQVFWVSGNHMPSPNSKPPSPKPIRREIFIYELTNRNQVKGQPPIYEAINTKFVKKVISNELGIFATYLRIGSYSMFTKENQGFFAGNFENESISPITVFQDSVTKTVIHINHTATY